MKTYLMFNREMCSDFRLVWAESPERAWVAGRASMPEPEEVPETMEQQMPGDDYDILLIPSKHKIEVLHVRAN
jgi:hypothetical protein